MKNKIVCGLLFATICFSLVGCRNNEQAKNSNTQVIKPIIEENVIDDMDKTENVSGMINSEESKETEQTEDENQTDNTSSESTENVYYGMSAAEIYSDINNLYVANLHEDMESGFYSYNGIVFTSSDCEKIEKDSKGAVNTYFKFDTSAFYNKLALCIDGYSIGNAWQSYMEHIIGFTPDSREDCEPYIKDLSSFIVTTNETEIILNRLEKTDGVTKNNENLIIDVPTCTKNLGISEEMFAYIACMLDSKGHSITFDGNTCTIE